MTSHLTNLSTTNTPYHSSTKTSTVTSLDVPKPSDTSYPSDLLFGGSRDEDFWVKDNGDIERLVEDVLQQTGYPDPVFVRDTLIEFNFDMVSTMDFILSFIMSQSEVESESPPQPTPVTQGLSVKKEVEALALDSGKVLLDLDTGIGISKESERTVEMDSNNDKEEPVPGDSEAERSNLSNGSDCNVSPSPPLRWESRGKNPPPQSLLNSTILTFLTPPFMYLESANNEDEAENTSLDEEQQNQFLAVVGVRNGNDSKVNH